MRTALLAALAPAVLSGCVTYHEREAPGFLRLGQTETVGPVRVTPLAVLEDSRCPKDVQCIWAGRVRIAARVNGERREMTLGEPVSAAGGQLVLTEVRPERLTDTAVPRTAYRFRFDFR
jgi:hypothetical protein